jgi:hypothetical protein
MISSQGPSQCVSPTFNCYAVLVDVMQADAPSSAYAAVDMTTDRLVTEVPHGADGIAAAAAAAAANAGMSDCHYTQQKQQQQVGAGYQPMQQQHAGSRRGSWSPTGQANMAGGAGRLQGVQQHTHCQPQSVTHPLVSNLGALPSDALCARQKAVRNNPTRAYYQPP